MPRVLDIRLLSSVVPCCEGRSWLIPDESVTGLLSQLIPTYAEVGFGQGQSGLGECALLWAPGLAAALPAVWAGAVHAWGERDRFRLHTPWKHRRTNVL